MTLSGAASTDWGADRYMNPPACFAALFAITGFTIDYNAKILRIKPSLPTSTQYALAGDSLIAAPLINPISCGTVDYRKVTASTPYQRFVIRFDNPMQFNTFYAKKLYAQSRFGVETGSRRHLCCGHDCGQQRGYLRVRGDVQQHPDHRQHGR